MLISCMQAKQLSFARPEVIRAQEAVNKKDKEIADNMNETSEVTKRIGGMDAEADNYTTRSMAKPLDKPKGHKSRGHQGERLPAQEDRIPVQGEGAPVQGEGAAARGKPFVACRIQGSMKAVYKSCIEDRHTFEWKRLNFRISPPTVTQASMGE